MEAPDDERCPRCAAVLELSTETGQLAQHACCRCGDTGRYRVETASIHDPRFGKALTCECQTSSPWERATDVPARLRGKSLFEQWLPPNGRPRLAAQSYVAVWPPARPLLTFIGDPGTGKTLLAVAIRRAALERHIVHGVYFQTAELLAQMRATMDAEASQTLAQVERPLRAAPLVLLDDIGAHASTDWTDEHLFTAVAYRYDRLLPTVLTVNPGAWDRLPDPLRSRLRDAETSEMVPMPGADQRPLQ